MFAFDFETCIKTILALISCLIDYRCLKIIEICGLTKLLQK